jgi:hypothetical protein
MLVAGKANIAADRTMDPNFVILSSLLVVVNLDEKQTFVFSA